jgi:hypothetical protein
VFRKPGVVRSFKMVDPVLFIIYIYIMFLSFAYENIPRVFDNLRGQEVPVNGI